MLGKPGHLWHNSLEQVIAWPHYFHKPVLLKSPGNESVLRVGVYQHWLRMFCGQFIFAMYVRKSRRKKTQNYIANTYHRRKLLLSGGFIVKKLFFQYPHRVFILLIVRVFFEMLTLMHNRILTLIRLGKPL